MCTSPCGGLSNGISSHHWVRGGYKSFFFFGFFFMVEGCSQIYVVFGGLGTQVQVLSLLWFLKGSEACWAPSILKKTKKRRTCTHPNLPSTLNPPKTIKDELVLTLQKPKKKGICTNPPNPLKGKKKIVHNPQTTLPFPQNFFFFKFEDKFGAKTSFIPPFFF